VTQLLLTLDNPKDEADFASFIALHPHVRVDVQESEKDTDGNYQWLDLTKPGIPTSKEYMNWRLADARKQILEGKYESQADFENWYFAIKSKQD
jgi:hypothetical protein